MVARQCRKSHERTRSRYAGLFYERLEFFVSLTQFHTLADKHERTLRCIYQFCSLFYCRYRRSGIRYIAAHTVNGDRFKIDQRSLCILGKVKHHRTRTSCTSNVECPCHRPCNILGTAYLVTPFRYGLCYTHEVNLLKRIGTQHCRRHLSGNYNHRSTVEHRITDTGQGIRCSRTACNYTQTDSSRTSRIALRCMYCTLFVTHKYTAEHITVIVHGIKHRHY